MELKFWKKKAASTGNVAGKDMPKPKELPQQLGRCLVVEKGNDPDRVWNLKMAYRNRVGDKDVIDFRLFNPEMATGKSLKIRSYDSLDGQMDLIQFSGRYNKSNGKVELDL